MANGLGSRKRTDVVSVDLILLQLKLYEFYNNFITDNDKLAKLIVLPSALKDTEGCRRHRRTMKAMKGIKGNEGIEYAKALSFPF